MKVNILEYSHCDKVGIGHYSGGRYSSGQYSGRRYCGDSTAANMIGVDATAGELFDFVIMVDARAIQHILIINCINHIT